MKIKHKILIVGITLLICGCTNMAPETIDESQGPSNCTPQFPGMNITYDNYVKNILSRNCIICHQGGNSPGLGNFTTYNGVKPHLDYFYVRVIQDRADMPQGHAPLPKSTRDSLNIWISNCSPEK
ncbi:MAG TPA: hypothetical protein DCL77_08850 [Prolixibacteraceae bacterium]|nr:hypothetical protein [Prolixibacteraceae bacterium]